MLTNPCCGGVCNSSNFIKCKFMNRANEWQKAKKQKEYANHPDAIKCEICGKKYIQVCSHVVQAHGILARDYKKSLGLDVGVSLIRGELKKTRREKNLENKSYEHLPESGKPTRYKKGHKRTYKRSKQTLRRLHKLGLLNKKEE